MRSHDTILGLVPYGFRVPSLLRACQRFWNARDERFLVPVIFSAVRTLNLRSAAHHPFQFILVTALILLRWHAGWRG